MKTKEIKTGASIWFCKKSGSAFISKMNNNKNYFVSHVNRSVLSDNFVPIRNGEYFFVTSVNVIKELNHTVVLTLSREKDNSQTIIRYEDLFHFCTN